MSRKTILNLAAAVTIGAASLASGSTYARGFGGGFGGGHFGGGHFGGGHFGGGNHFAGGSHFSGRGGRLIPILNPGHHPGWPGHPGHPHFPGGGWVWNHHHHWHWAFRGGSWVYIDDMIVGGAVDVSTPAPDLCTCLTKTYTQNGLVVFADICTKEAASASVSDSAADAMQAPTSGATQGPSSSTTPGPTSSATQGPTASATQGPTVGISKVPTSPNYAGRTYADYLAANPQAAQAVPQDQPKN